MGDLDKAVVFFIRLANNVANLFGTVANEAPVFVHRCIRG